MAEEINTGPFPGFYDPQSRELVEYGKFASPQFGDWTPFVMIHSLNNTTITAVTHTKQIGKYVRLGSLYSVIFHLSWSAVTGYGELRIGGLPNFGHVLQAGGGGAIASILGFQGKVVLGTAFSLTASPPDVQASTPIDEGIVLRTPYAQKTGSNRDFMFITNTSNDGTPIVGTNVRIGTGAGSCAGQMFYRAESL